jgi:hypothetical protein
MAAPWRQNEPQIKVEVYLVRCGLVSCVDAASLIVIASLRNSPPVIFAERSNPVFALPRRFAPRNDD